MASQISVNASLAMDWNEDKSSICRRTGNHQPNLWGSDFMQSLGSLYGESCYRERAEALIGEIKGMLNAMGDGEISPSAYDTAWVAKVAAIDGKDPLFPQTLDWILQNQLKDGSWGTISHFLLSERLLSTLSCVLALIKWNTGYRQVEQGLAFIRDSLPLMNEEIQDSMVTEFELIFPSLLKEAQVAELSLPYDSPLVKRLFNKREERLARIRVDPFQSVPSSLSYCLEGLLDIIEIDWKRIMSVQCNDGSFSGSPSATACVFMHTGDQKCLAFLNSVVAKFGNCVPCLYPVDLLERLLVVDNIERLGIGRHFRKEIKQALDYVFRHWDDERGVGHGRGNSVPDLEITALGFRLLRLHRYNVSPVVLEKFKDQISGSFRQSHTKEVASMLSLFKASEIAFPGEEIMDEAKSFTTKYLAETLTMMDTSNKYDVGQEIKYALENPWRSSVPRLEAKRYCQVYTPDYAWLGKSLYKLPLVNNEKYLELAKLDFNILQWVHQEEMKDVARWFDRDSGLAEFTFARARPIEFYFTVCAGTFEAELRACRLNFVKVASMQTVLDDMYDTYATLDELHLFADAVKRWDVALTDNLPDYMKSCFKVWYDIVHQVAWEAEREQGRELLGFFRTLWEEFLEGYLKEAEWLASEHVPTLDAYIKNGLDSIGTRLLLLSGIFFLGELLPDNILRQIDRPAKFTELIDLITRLMDDTKTYKAEKARGELASAVQCYVKEHPGSTEDGALNHLYGVIDCSVKELTWEFLKPDKLPLCFKKYLLDVARVVMLIFKDADGYSISAKDTKRFITETLLEPLPLPI